MCINDVCVVQVSCFSCRKCDNDEKISLTLKILMMLSEIKVCLETHFQELRYSLCYASLIKCHLPHSLIYSELSVQVY